MDSGTSQGSVAVEYGRVLEYPMLFAILRFRPPQIDQILPFFPNSEKRDFLRKKYRGLGVWSNLEIGELVR